MTDVVVTRMVHSPNAPLHATSTSLVRQRLFIQLSCPLYKQCIVGSPPRYENPRNVKNPRYYEQNLRLENPRLEINPRLEKESEILREESETTEEPETREESETRKESKTQELDMIDVEESTQSEDLNDALLDL